KSKLYDAFYWAMYDECYDTYEKQWKKTRILGKAIISDKAIYESSDGFVQASVKLTFKDVAKDCQYIIERIFMGEKKNVDFIVNPDSTEQITYRHIAGMTGRLVTNIEEVERIKKKILPDN